MIAYKKEEEAKGAKGKGTKTAEEGSTTHKGK